MIGQSITGGKYFLSALQRADDSLFFVEKTLCLTIIIILTLTTFTEVILRYIFNSTLLVGISELTNWAFVWLVFIGSAAVTKKKGHIGITYFYEKIPFRFQRVFSLIINGILIAFSIVVVQTGFRFAANQKVILTTAANIPKMYLYLAVPVGMLFLMFHLFTQTLSLVIDGDVKQREN